MNFPMMQPQLQNGNPEQIKNLLLNQANMLEQALNAAKIQQSPQNIRQFLPPQYRFPGSVHSSRNISPEHSLLAGQSPFMSHMPYMMPNQLGYQDPEIPAINMSLLKQAQSLDPKVAQKTAYFSQMTDRRDHNILDLKEKIKNLEFQNDTLRSQTLPL